MGKAKLVGCCLLVHRYLKKNVTVRVESIHNRVYYSSNGFFVCKTRHGQNIRKWLAVNCLASIATAESQKLMDSMKYIKTNYWRATMFSLFLVTTIHLLANTFWLCNPITVNSFQVWLVQILLLSLRNVN